MRLMKYNAVFFLLLGMIPSSAKAWDVIADAIYNAAASGHYGAIDYYLNRGYSIDATDERGVTALCRAKYNNNQQAYNVLLNYGADPKASCMYKTPTSVPARKAFFTTTWSPYIFGAAVLAGGAALALSGGGGGGGSSSGSSSQDSGNNDSSNNDNSGNYSRVINGDNGGDIGSGNNKPSANYTPYTIEDFRKDPEYTGEWFNGGTTETGKTIYSVNYHEPIHAAQAYAEFYGYDDDGNVVSKLSGNALVGILDTGVNRAHREFKDVNGNSVVTKWHNYDFGPCTSANNQNCWQAVQNKNDPSIINMKLLLNGLPSGEELSLGLNTYNKWAASYPSSYVYAENDDTPSSASDHGSNVAGIVAANWNPNGYGTMGIAFTNTQIDAIRWDMKSSFERPIQAFLNDQVDVVNMSLGTGAQDAANAGMPISSLSALLAQDSNIFSAAQMTMDSYVHYDAENATDGMIWVLAAGNENYSQPTIESGLKLLDDYKNLMMLTVVSVRVNADGTYSRSDFSNKCGVTKGYCIAAPGGDGANSGSTVHVLYNASNSSSYVGMAGTSQATPVVSGSIAFLREAYPWMKSSQIIDLLRETANTNGVDYDQSTNHEDTTYGAGLIDLGAAVMTYVSDTSVDSITTVGGDSVYSNNIMVNNAHLNISAPLAKALQNALPKTITVFDKYKRPFEMQTSNYISGTHSGYKNLKTDVMGMMTPKMVKRQQKNGMSFAYTESPKGGFSMMNAEYRSGKHSSGFYLSQDTRYGTIERTSRDMSNPFMAMTSAYGLTHQYRLNDFMQIKMEAVGGENALYDGDFEFGDSSFHRSAYAVNTELTLKRNNLFSFGISSGLLYEDGALLGTNGRGAFGISDGQTYTTGATMSLFLTDKLSLSGSYYRGYTQAKNFDSNLMRTTRLLSDSFAVDANYRWNKDVDFGIRVSSPLRIEKGSLLVNFPSGRDSYSNKVYREQYAARLNPNKREYKFAMYLNNNVNEKLSWRAEFDTRVHPEHQDAANDYRALLGMSYAF